MSRCDHIGHRDGEEHRCVLPADHIFAPHQYGPLPRTSRREQPASRSEDDG